MAKKTVKLTLDTEKGFRYLVEKEIFPLLNHIMDKDGEIIPVAHIITRVDPETQKRLETPGIVSAICKGASKEAWVESIKQLSIWLSACGIIVINEAWMVTDKTDSVKLRTLPPSESPDRIEIVIVVIEHVAIGREMWVSNIIREENKQPILSEFKKTFSSKEKSKNSSFEGRFTRFIPETSEEMN